MVLYQRLSPCQQTPSTMVYSWPSMQGMALNIWGWHLRVCHSYTSKPVAHIRIGFLVLAYLFDSQKKIFTSSGQLTSMTEHAFSDLYQMTMSGLLCLHLTDVSMSMSHQYSSYWYLCTCSKFLYLFRDSFFQISLHF